MSDDGGFLRAIKDNPDDDAARLAYADWLEERGDDRGEYLRLEHQQSQISRRLAQLRDQVDRAWLTAVSRRCKVVIASFQPDRKIEVIRLVRLVTGLALKEAKDLVESTSRAVGNDLTAEEAKRIAKQFEGVAVVSVEPAVGGAWR